MKRKGAILRMKDIELIQILWDYMKMNQKLEKADCIIVLGSVDISIVDVAVEIYSKGYADKIIFSGGLRKNNKQIVERARSK